MPYIFLLLGLVVEKKNFYTRFGSAIKIFVSFTRLGSAIKIFISFTWLGTKSLHLYISSSILAIIYLIIP